MSAHRCASAADRLAWLAARPGAGQPHARRGSAAGIAPGSASAATALAMTGLVHRAGAGADCDLRPAVRRSQPPPSPRRWPGPAAADDAGRIRSAPTSWAATSIARVIFGSRITLTIVALVSVIVVPVGLAIGLPAGYFGGWIDTVLMRITDIFLAFPRLVLALAFAAALGPGIENAVIAIALTAWPPYARLARAETLTRPAGRVHRRRPNCKAPRTCASCSRRSCRCACPRDHPPHARHGRHHPHRRRPRLPRPRRPAAGAGMGRHGLLRPAVAARPVVGGDHPGPGHLHRQPRLQPARRRAARRRGFARSDERWPCSTVRNLRVTYPGDDGDFRAVRNVILHPRAASASASSANSGSGKSTTGPRHHGPDPPSRPRRGRRDAPAASTDLPGLDETRISPPARQAHRHGAAGPEILARPGDDASASRSPRPTAAIFAAASRRRRDARRWRCCEAVHIRDPERVYDQYPHQVSGGMGQRIMIAMMLIAGPRHPDRRRTHLGARRHGAATGAAPSWTSWCRAAAWG